MSCNVAKLLELGEHVDEKVVLLINKTKIKTFDEYGRFYPLHVGRTYLVKLSITQLDFHPIEILDEEKSYAEQINGTFAYNLYGIVRNGALYVEDIKFADEDLREDIKDFEGKNIKYRADRIVVEFEKELDNDYNAG